MNKINRLSSPDCLNNQIQSSKAKKIKFYENLRYQGKIKPRWNTACKEGDKVSKIRQKLLQMSNETCVYCGIKIDDVTMDVDHYLPSSLFPYLAYSWDNLVPSCKKCNQNIKSDFSPASLTGKKIVENILSDNIEHELVYDKKQLLDSVNDRLIEPTFDNPEEHLEFNPEFYFYENKTKIGEITIRKFFVHKEVAEKWEELSKFIKKTIINSKNEQAALDMIKSFIELNGNEYVCLKFYQYWLQEKDS
ncbi:HNH endonuclease [Candidatus Halobeggiatoa sp. HSG11]|nr:HNH endonuclease [Candidatus Halobeggiatoa sp. HSG11]